MGKTCSVESCAKPAAARGWCSKHYTRWRRYGAAVYRISGEVVNGCRICPGCKLDKPLDQYGNATGRCRSCLAASQRVRRLSVVRVPLPEIHCIVCSERFTPTTSETYCCSSGCSSRRKKSLDSYYQKVDNRADSRRKWESGHPESRVEREGRRRARKRASQVVRVSGPDIARRMSYFGNRCWMCRGPFECIDHVKPLSKGGPHMLANLRPACAKCNVAKSDKWLGAAGLGDFITALDRMEVPSE